MRFLSSFSTLQPARSRRAFKGVSSGGVFLSGVAALLIMGFSDSASAYCTLHTCKDVTPDDVEASEDEELKVKTCKREDTCIVEGDELFWRSPCLSYGVSALNTSVLDLTPSEFDAIIEDAFKVWANVECPGGGNPGFNIQSVGVVDTNGNFFCKEEPLANVSVWSLVTRWPRDPAALGYTSSTHNKNDGEIFDADVELNLRKIEADHKGNYPIVMGRIAVHEAGHYLGLGHSNLEAAVMFDSYNSLDLLTKELTQDDIDGICDLYPPNSKLECSEAGYVEAALNQEACDEAALADEEDEAEASGCSVAHLGRPDTRMGWLGQALALVLLGAVVRRRGHTDTRRSREV